MNHSHWWKHALVGSALVVGSYQMALAADDWRPDAWITTKTKIALMTTADVHANAVDVDTVEGRVTLHGKVSSEAEKEKAEAVAKDIQGVKSVRNLLQVVRAPESHAVEVADSAIKDHAENALKGDRSLADSDLKIESVNKGVVLLSGKAASLGDYLRALQDIEAVPGVRQVAAEVTSPDTISEADAHRGTTAGGITQGASDMWITSATKLRLLANSKTPALDISVDTRDGVVTLFGIVPSNEASEAAEHEAHGVSGVKAVKNELQVVAKPRQEAVKVRDDELQKKVNAALESPPLNQADIDVAVKNGVVRLTGSVPSESHRLAAAIVARSVAGVRSVEDDLQVKSPRG